MRTRGRGGRILTMCRYLWPAKTKGVSRARLRHMRHDEWSDTQTDRSQLGRCFDTVSPQAVHGDGPVRLTTARTLWMRDPPCTVPRYETNRLLSIRRGTTLRGPWSIWGPHSRSTPIRTGGSKTDISTERRGAINKNVRKSPSPRGAIGVQRRAVRRVYAP